MIFYFRSLKPSLHLRVSNRKSRKEDAPSRFQQKPDTSQPTSMLSQSFFDP